MSTRAYIIQYENDSTISTLTILAATYAALSHALISAGISGDSILSIQIIGG